MEYLHDSSSLKMSGIPSTMSPGELLETLISKQKWENAYEVLTCLNVGKNGLRNRFHCGSKCEGNHSLLHLVIRLHPPACIVKAILDIFPEATFETDCMKRYPLHVAAQYGTCDRVIKMLLKENPKAAEIHDSNGYTPLQLVFKNYEWKTKAHIAFGNEFKKATPRICALLCKVAPNSVMEEIDGVSVIESALMQDAEMRVIEILQRASERALKEEYKIKMFEKQAVQVMTDAKPQMVQGKNISSSSRHRRISLIVPEKRTFNSIMA